VKLVPVYEFKFPEPGPEHFSITCKNHTFLRWITKNPYQRNIHYLGLADGTKENGFWMWQECACPFGDLVVITETEGVVT